MSKIICLIGPSGSGKTTVGQYLQTKGIPEIVSHTTRTPRIGEIDNISYYFVKEDIFKSLEFVEKACYSGDWYGTSKKEIEEKLQNYELAYSVIEINGYQNLKKLYGNKIIGIFLEISEDECINRMINRGDLKESINKRITNYHRINEFDNGRYCDYICNMEQSFVKVYNDIDNILKQIKKEDI